MKTAIAQQEQERNFGRSNGARCSDYSQRPIDDPMNRTKTCTNCRQSLPFSRFDCSATSKDGFAQKCKNCAVLYNKKPGPKRLKIKVEKDQLAWHAGSKKDLTDYQRKVIAGKQHGGFKRDPKAVPPRTYLWSDNPYWQEKTAYVRETGNRDIKSRGV